MPLTDLIIQLKELQTNEQSWMRPVVTALIGEVRNRIHVEGLRADGGPIGEYKNPYLRFRQQKHNRTADTKMIYSLTRQMEQDFVPVAESDVYGLGFNNSHNFDKASWQEERRPGVYDLSEKEIELAEIALTEYLNGIFE